MLEKLIPKEESRVSFEARLDRLSWQDRQDIMYAYDFAKYAHSRELRDNGVRYFEHARGSTLILLDECKIFDPIKIKSELLHDVLENTSIFGNARYHTHEELIRIANYRISKTFKSEVAEILIPISKPNGIDLQTFTDEEINKMYHQQLEKASIDTLLVKMPDRLHNLREIPFCTIEKQKRKIRETEEFYLPLFEKVLIGYPEEGRYLLSQIRIALANAIQRQKLH